MAADKKTEAFLSQYDEEVYSNAIKLREILFMALPGITEQVDIPAKMVMYCYGQKYTEMVCGIIPSRKGLKLGFYKGADLPDPANLLEGNGKISRYVVIKGAKQIGSASLKKLVKAALAAYKQRMTALKKS
ncbi:MAG TPA: DUF1801 domain-containing protein [Ferruginibacter sp.]|nr:DUF1801 domain-containing protein [Ferruginibacter sp.]